MAEFIEACTQSPVNLVLSVLLVLIFLYWIIVILGAVGIDSLDFDLDFDGDADIDIDTDTHGAVFGAGLGVSILRFFHVGTVPVLVLFSIFILTLWAIGVISYRWIGGWGVVLQLLMVVPFALVALFLTRFISTPIKIVFEKLREEEDAEQHINLIGQRCVVASLNVDHKHGQVEVKTEGSPLRLNAVTGDEADVLNKGDEAVIVSQDESRGIYIVRGF